MGGSGIFFVGQGLLGPGRNAGRSGTTEHPCSRIRIDGKFFTRGGRSFRIQGVTYGPFTPNAWGEPFPVLEKSADDISLMRAAGINAVRTYHLPPRWFLEQADEEGMAVFIDVPWRKHLCFLDSAEARVEARKSVRQAAGIG